MKFAEFERHARVVFDEIPDVYRQGIDGLVVRREAPEHPELPGVFTLGECITEEHLSDFGSADTTRSLIALYWGSFRAVARENPDFDWEEEVWETLTHELRHHLESLAGDDALEDVDHAADETSRRFDGQPYDPWYYQYGDVEGPGVFRVEKVWYVETVLTSGAFDQMTELRFDWRGRQYRMPKPAEQGDVHFVLTGGLDVDPDEIVEVVLVRRRSWWQAAKRLLGSSPAEVLESEAEAEPVDPEG